MLYIDSSSQESPFKVEPEDKDYFSQVAPSRPRMIEVEEEDEDYCTVMQD